VVIFVEVLRGLFEGSGIGMLARGREGIGGISYGSLTGFSPSTQLFFKLLKLAIFMD